VAAVESAAAPVRLAPHCEQKLAESAFNVPQRTQYMK
jgi:hypothetical protein